MQHAMDIDKCLRLSIFTGLIGCIILVHTVNYGGQDNQTPSSSPIPLPFSSSSSSSGTTPTQHLSEPTISVLQNQIEQSSSPTSSAQTQKNPTVVFNEEIVDEQVLLGPTRSSMENDQKKGRKEKTERCNMFDVYWVYNPKRSPAYKAPQCPFLTDLVSCQKNGRPDSEYEKWTWESKECQIPRFNGVDMLERLKGKRVIIVGDSINSNQWESLVCLLYSAIPSSGSLLDLRTKVFKAKDYECSVEYHCSPFLVELVDGNKRENNGSRILRLDRLSASARSWKGADVMLFNTGHWWRRHHGRHKAWDLIQYKGKLVEKMEIESAFKMAIRTWARWIDRNVDKTRTTVFFRSFSPVHFGKHFCYNRTQPIMDPSYVNPYPKKLKEIVERIIRGMKTSVRYMDITKLAQYRVDAHPSVYATKNNHARLSSDCSHWCLPGLPETWNRLFYASMVLEDLAYPSPSSLVG